MQSGDNRGRIKLQLQLTLRQSAGGDEAADKGRFSFNLVSKGRGSLSKKCCTRCIRFGQQHVPLGGLAELAQRDLMKCSLQRLCGQAPA